MKTFYQVQISDLSLLLVFIYFKYMYSFKHNLTCHLPDLECNPFNFFLINKCVRLLPFLSCKLSKGQTSSQAAQNQSSLCSFCVTYANQYPVRLFLQCYCFACFSLTSLLNRAFFIKIPLTFLSLNLIFSFLFV